MGQKFFQDDLNGAKEWIEAQTIRKDVHNRFKGAIQIPSNMGLHEGQIWKMAHGERKYMLKLKREVASQCYRVLLLLVIISPKLGKNILTPHFR